MALIPQDAVQVKGLRELQASLKAIDGEAQKELRVALNAAIEDLAEAVRRKVPSQSGKARASVKAASGQREARIKAGSAKAPYYPWLDFGGKVGKNRSVDRKFKPEGRYLYPTYKAKRGEVLERVADQIFGLIEKHGLDASGR